MVADNPVGRKAADMGGAVGKVLCLAGAEPCGVGGDVGGFFRLPFGAKGDDVAGRRQFNAVKALLADKRGEMPEIGAADEGDVVVVLAQLLGEGEAAHDVSAADLQRCVCADKEFHDVEPLGQPENGV